MNGMLKFSVFKDNMRDIIAHNQKPNVTWTRGLGPFTDLTGDEFLDTYTFRNDMNAEDKCKALQDNLFTIPQERANSYIPKSFDLVA